MMCNIACYMAGGAVKGGAIYYKNVEVLYSSSAYYIILKIAFVIYMLYNMLSRQKNAI